MADAASARYPLFVKRDLDGFFGLAVDNLVQMLLIVALCGAYCGMTGDNAAFIYRHILPGVAVSLLIGNIFYAAQAHWVARREKRSDVTALPYGINTPSLLVYIFFVMKPAYDQQGAAYAWRLGLIACLGSGLIEFFGAFVAERLRRRTPRAALLSTLAGIAIAFISMPFALQIWQRPLVAMVPMGIILLTYFARARFPLGLPGGFVAVVVGTAIAWLLSLTGMSGDVLMTLDGVREASHRTEWYLPIWAGNEIRQTLQNEARQILPLLSVIIPMGLFNLIGSLQNIESAEAGGDVFATGPSLAVNGMGTVAAALFGSCFPTTIYIGHPGWKALGARAGYSTLNGLVMTVICLSGTVLLISKVIPLEAGIAIVLWIGVIITAQAFQATPARHAPAVAIGLFPAIAAWGATVMAGAFMEAGRDITVCRAPAAVATAPAIGVATRPATQVAPAAVLPVPSPSPAEVPHWKIRAATMQEVLEAPNGRGLNTEVQGFLIHGLNILDRGYIFTCMILGAVAAFLIDRRFRAAAAWCVAASILTLLRLMHAYQLSGNIVDYLPIFSTPRDGAFVYRAYPLAVAYLLMAGLFLFMGSRERGSEERPAATEEDARVVPDYQ